MAGLNFHQLWGAALLRQSPQHLFLLDCVPHLNGNSLRFIDNASPQSVKFIIIDSDETAPRCQATRRLLRLEVKRVGGDEEGMTAPMKDCPDEA